MLAVALHFLRSLIESIRDLAPIVAVVAFFQLVVLGQPIPNLMQLLTGTLLVVLGLTLFVHGLKIGLFPIGETMAHAFARKGSLLWILVFAFARSREAISHALHEAREGDLVIVAGKGHEDYQVTGGEIQHFDDRETVRDILSELLRSEGEEERSCG